MAKVLQENDRPICLRDTLLPKLMSGKLKIKESDFDERKIEKVKAMILSMTKKEREKPEIINSSRKKRIAAGSGTTVQDINQLLKQFEQTKLMMKQFKNGKRLPFMR